MSIVSTISKYIPVIGSIARTLDAPDTARCTQGATLILRHMLQQQQHNLGQDSAKILGHIEQLHEVGSQAVRQQIILPSRSNGAALSTLFTFQPGDVASQQDDPTIEERRRMMNVAKEKIRRNLNPPDESIHNSPNQAGVDDAQEETADIPTYHSTLASNNNQHDAHVRDQLEKGMKQHDEVSAGSLASAPRKNRASMKEARVPSTPIGRLVGFGQLAVGLVAGTVTESIRRQVGGTSQQGSSSDIPPPSAWMSEGNSDLLSASLCRMRGAALKLGQMLSIQDDAVLHPVLRDALERVRHAADYMPKEQLNQSMTIALGDNWRANFSRFEDVPIAAASLGQVHDATLLDGTRVAVKVQYPGVADSIDSDVGNLRRLAKYTGMFPKGLYIDSIIETMQRELKLECDYEEEAKNQEKFRSLLANDPAFEVPRVIPELSTRNILTSTYCNGITIDEARHLPQTVRNNIGRRLLRLTLQELFEFRFMQADPNFANYLYDPESDRIVLLDFGACSTFDKSFVDDYIELVWAAANNDRDKLLEVSYSLGMLTGKESDEMIHAHVEAGLLVGAPFVRNAPYNFGVSKVPTQTAKHGETFMRERLTPPPQEIYPLHRKLSGSYMACIRIGAIIQCRDLLEQTYASYHKR